VPYGLSKCYKVIPSVQHWSYEIGQDDRIGRDRIILSYMDSLMRPGIPSLCMAALPGKILVVHQLWLSPEHDMRVGIIASGWGSVSLSQFTLLKVG